MDKFSDFFPGKWVKRILPIAFVLGLLANFPASIIWDYAQSRIQLQRQLSVEGVSGSLWQGETLISIRDQGRRLQLKGEWKLGLPALLESGELFVLVVNHPGTELKLIASPGWNFASISGQLSGHLHPLLLNPFLKQNKAWISGDTSINALAFRVQNGRPESLTGSVIWQGGETYFLPPSGKSPRLIRYPQLAIKAFTGSDGAIDTQVTALGTQEPLIKASLMKDGWLSVAVFGRIKQAVPDLPVPRKPLDQTLVKYKEKVF